ncbi:MAG TPA: hypothetical protein VFA18_03445, partial [Gemmataceae bacterium]|nr:hypothetical protein [Gemmataceae bacterium]
PGSRADSQVNVSLTIDALVVTGAMARTRLLPNIDGRLLVADAVAGLQHAPAGLGLAAWAASPAGPLGPGALATQKRDYTALANKDPFYGRPPPPEERRDDVDVTRFVYLTSITTDGPMPEAYIFNRIDDRRQRVRNRPGYRDFYANDSLGETRMRGQVVAFKERDLLFQSDGQYYVFHVGDTLHDALQHRLSKEEVNSFLGKTAEVRKPATASTAGLR